jgi:hypothetical protein
LILPKKMSAIVCIRCVSVKCDKSSVFSSSSASFLARIKVSVKSLMLSENYSFINEY